MNIENRIKEIALKFCADYPNIENCNTLEQIYAIECTLQGWNTALDDWGKVAVKKGITDKDFENL